MKIDSYLLFDITHSGVSQNMRKILGNVGAQSTASVYHDSTSRVVLEILDPVTGEKSKYRFFHNNKVEKLEQEVIEKWVEV